MVMRVHIHAWIVNIIPYRRSWCCDTYTLLYV